MLQQLTTSQQQPIAKQDDKPKRVEIRGKLKAALDAMVWDGLELAEACRAFNYHAASMRKALQRPHIQAYLRSEREVLRASLSPRNIHRLREIRDAADNMPAVNAIKVLEQLGDEQATRGSGASASPGVTIRILNVTAPSHDILTKTVTSEQNQRLTGDEG